MDLKDFTGSTPDLKPWLSIVCSSVVCNNLNSLALITDDITTENLNCSAIQTDTLRANTISQNGGVNQNSAIQYRQLTHYNISYNVGFFSQAFNDVLRHDIIGPISNNASIYRANPTEVEIYKLKYIGSVVPSLINSSYGVRLSINDVLLTVAPTQILTNVEYLLDIDAHICILNNNSNSCVVVCSGTFNYSKTTASASSFTVGFGTAQISIPYDNSKLTVQLEIESTNTNSFVNTRRLFFLNREV